MKAKYKIYVADYKKKTVLKMPTLPEDMPEKKRNASITTFTNYKGEVYNIIGHRGAIEMEYAPWIPGIGRKLPFTLSGTKAEQFAKLINSAMLKKEPIRVIIIRTVDNSKFINNLFAVETFNYYEKRNTNFEFTMSLKEWRKY